MDQLVFDQFTSRESLGDVASLLGIKKGTLAYILYGIDRDSQYKQFTISKKNGGERLIETPTTALKTIQRRLGIILQDVYWRRPSAFGFVKGFSVKHNAARHCKKKFVFNIDLENFFHSIHFGRVRGLFAAPPISLPINIATIIAQICCYEGRLPQGASTSPIVSNMVCTKLDRDLQKLAQSCRCHYTRYADDITFSTNNPIDIEKIWQLDDSQFNVSRIVRRLFYGESKPPTYKDATVGKELNELIEENGFTVNTNKVRLASSRERQEVTGLVVNRFPNVRREYIRRTRAILHSWRTQGLEVASKRFFKSGYTWNGQGEKPLCKAL